jgi:hypothetical protein
MIFTSGLPLQTRLSPGSPRSGLRISSPGIYPRAGPASYDRAVEKMDFAKIFEVHEMLTVK